MRILAVDDDPHFLELLQGTLICAGYEQVEYVDSAKAALAAVRAAEVPFDCFLLDIRMPGTDGIELCRQLRALPACKQAPILMLTAVIDEEVIDRAFEAGANDYVTKPLKGVEVGARIRMAAMLAEQTRQTVCLRQSAGKMQARLDTLTKIELSAELDLAGGPCCLSMPQLHGLLRLLPSGGYNMSVFALRIAEIDEAHAALGPGEFFAFLSDIAKTISERIAPRDHYIAYAGDGIFGAVAFGRDRATEQAGPEAMKYAGKIPTPMAGAKVGRVTLGYNQSAESRLLSGIAGAAALRKALAAARDLKKLDQMRLDLDADRMGARVVVPQRPRLLGLGRSLRPQAI